MLEVLNRGSWTSNFNDTRIALIPKVKAPSNVTEFRPISLCNVLYKIVAKFLANRLKHILPDIISPTQSVFVPGMLITDNVIVTFDLLHTMTKRMKDRDRFMALKLDMSKVSKKFEWKFLHAVMSKIGFVKKWIDFVMQCVTSMSHSLIINGSPLEKFYPSRGIRQGDHLSPYLFILVSEALSSILNNVELDGLITDSLLLQSKFSGMKQTLQHSRSV